MNLKKYKDKWERFNLNLFRKFIHIIGFTKDNTSRNLFRLFQIAFYAVIIVFVINLFSFFSTNTNFGTFGDFFGGVLNPILTFLTFMGLLITIILQQKELKQSRKEFQGQKESLENQEFDNKFFQMLNLLNNISDRLAVNIKNDDLDGKNIFEYLKEKLHNDIYYLYDQDLTNNSLQEDKFLYFQKGFNKFNNTYDTTFKYYFINLYQLLKYIDTYSNNEVEAKEYTNMIRAQLTKNALILLAYNAIGVKNFTTNQYQLLVEKYAFFEHLRYDDFCENENIINIINTILSEYDDKAFGKNNLDLIKIIRGQKKYRIEEKDKRTPKEKGEAIAAKLSDLQ